MLPVELRDRAAHRAVAGYAEIIEIHALDRVKSDPGGSTNHGPDSPVNSGAR